jgi:hypothetical protein
MGAFDATGRLRRGRCACGTLGFGYVMRLR